MGRHFAEARPAAGVVSWGLSRLDAFVQGDEVEVVFLHPLPFDGGFWDDIRAEFEDFASWAPTMYSPGTDLETVARNVLASVGGSRLVLVGNSLGGSCALEVAAVAPERVEHVVLIGAKAGHRPEPAYRDWALELLRQRGVGAAWEEIWAPLFAAGTSPEIIQQAKSAALALSVDSIAAGIEMFHSRRDLDQWLEGWSGPLTVVSGSKDTAPLPAVGKATAGRVRHGRFRIVEGSGHYVPIEQPEAMTSILAEVLRGEG